jgi:hypothetical protein
MVTDSSKLPRETYYACPHCMLKLELTLQNENIDKSGHVCIHTAKDEALLSELKIRTSGLSEAVSNPQTTRPTKGCKHFLGYLQTHNFGAEIPDECAICPNIVKCYSYNGIKK